MVGKWLRIVPKIAVLCSGVADTNTSSVQRTTKDVVPSVLFADVKDVTHRRRLEPEVVEDWLDPFVPQVAGVVRAPDVALENQDVGGGVVEPLGAVLAKLDPHVDLKAGREVAVEGLDSRGVVEVRVSDVAGLDDVAVVGCVEGEETD